MTTIATTAAYPRLRVDVDAVILASIDDPRGLLRILGIDLHSIDPDISVTCEWRCGVEGTWWPISGHMIHLSDLTAVRWTWTAEAGVDDVEIVGRSGDDDEDSVDLLEWCRDIAAQC